MGNLWTHRDDPAQCLMFPELQMREETWSTEDMRRFLLGGEEHSCEDKHPWVPLAK